MRIVLFIGALLSSVILTAGEFETKFSQAQKHFKAESYREAATAYEEAVLEAENDSERIKAKFGCLESLKLAHVEKIERISAAETLLYDEPTLTPAQVLELTEYICEIAAKETRKKAIEFAQKQQDFSGKQRSRVLLLILNESGFWAIGVPEKILEIEYADPEAKALAYGNLGNVTLHIKRQPEQAILLFGKALVIPELSQNRRQFFTLCKARAYLANENYAEAEQLYRQAIAMATAPDFQEAAYEELNALLIKTLNIPAARLLISQAASDQSLRPKARKKFKLIEEKTTNRTRSHYVQSHQKINNVAHCIGTAGAGRNHGNRF